MYWFYNAFLFFAAVISRRNNALIFNFDRFAGGKVNLVGNFYCPKGNDRHKKKFKKNTHHCKINTFIASLRI